MRRSFRPLHFLVAAAAALVLLVGCQPGFQTSPMRPVMAEPVRHGDHTSRISVFLNLKEAEGPGVRLEISSLEILSDGIWWPLASKVHSLDSEAIGAGQVFLGGRPVPPGNLHRLRFAVTESSIRRGDGSYQSAPVDAPLVEIDLHSPLTLAEGDSRSLFVTWDVQESLELAGFLRPALTIAPQIVQLPVDLVYVAAPDIDTVFVIRSDRNWVADSFGVKGGPTFLAIDPDPARRRLYVLASGDATIKVVDLSSQRVVDFIHIPLTDLPTFMTISPDGRWAYVLEERSSYLSRIDLATGRSAARVRIRYRPSYAAFLEDQNLLAVSAGLTQAVSLHNPMDLNEIRNIRTGSAPEGLLVAGRELYIAESGDHSVSIYDLGANRILRRLDVGFGPRRILFTGNQIYVSNYDNGTISVLFPGQMGSVREIHGLGRPLEMVHEPAYRRIYVGDERAAGLAVVDSVANQLIGFITFGARPMGLAVLQ